MAYLGPNFAGVFSLDTGGSVKHTSWRDRLFRIFPLCAYRRAGAHSRLQPLMSHPGQIVLIPMMVAVTSVLSWSADAKAQPKPINACDEAHKTVSPEVADREQSQRPLGLPQMPPASPMVTYSGGQLTVIGQNATLADILSAICRQTGVAIDLPPGSGNERIVSQVGPGSTREVLAALLNGSHFDYAMIGSPSNPAAIEHIVLIPRGNESETIAPVENPTVAPGSWEQQPSPREVPPAQTAPQPTQKDTAEAQTTSDESEDAVDDSQLPTTEMISEGEDPLPEQTVQQLQLGGLPAQSAGQQASPGQASLPQPPGTNPQHAGNGDSPPPPPPH